MPPRPSVATFNRAGAYTFQVTITDSGGLTVASSVNVTVNQTFTSIVVSPSSVTLPDRGKQQFTAQALDQFSQALASQPAFTWSKLSGRGSINRTGLYTAPASGTGTAVIQAKAGGKVGQATITIGAARHSVPRKSKPMRMSAAHALRKHRLA